MRIKMSLRLAGLLGLLLLAMAGCGRASTATNTTKSVQLPRGETLYVLDGYAGMAATQRILAFQPGKGTSALLTLPVGVTSYDHTTLYAASAAAGHTTIAVINTRTGGALRSITLAGSYETAGPGYGASTISPDGKWLALRQSGTTGGTTTIALLDTQAGRLAKTVSLPGDFELDAISPDGQVLYLIENLHDAAHHYYVKAYDVASATLGDWVIVDKTEIENPKMQGTPLTRQMAPNGSVAYTLYINAAQNSAFIHVLPLVGSANDARFARCVDLPVGSAGSLLKYYTLALAPDGSHLYATNAALGVSNVVDLHGPDVLSDNLTSTAHFTAAGDTALAWDFYGGAALAAGSGMLYVAGAHGIVALHTPDMQMKDVYLAGGTFTGLALSGDGRTLYAVDPANGIVPLNLATGKAGAALRGPAATPWGVAWVAE